MTKPNILLIMLDAVRADNLSVYGYERETTPNLEKIREEFQIYQNPISASHWSLPSAASLFTGTYPSTHGLIHDDTVLDSRFTTLAQFLKTQGYATIGICPNPYISHETGLDRGFDVFPGRGVDPLKNVMARFREGKEKIEDRNEKPKVRALAQQKSTLEKILMTDHIRRLEWFIRGKMDKYAASTNARFIREIKKSDINQPFFAYLHYDEAHTPYIIPNNYRTKFQVNKKVKPWKVNQDWVKYYIEKPDISDEEFQALKDVYDGGILYLDKIIYNLYESLEKMSLLENTLICILGDHGDQFGEHGLYYHLFSLYDELIKIPMMIKYPDGVRPLYYDVVQNVDIFPTIVDMLNYNGKHLLDQMEGSSLVSKKIEKRDSRYAYSELLKPFGPKILKYRDQLQVFDRLQFSVRSNSHKYIYSTDGKHQLFNLLKDPRENNNIIRKKDDNKNELKYLIEQWVDKYTSSVPYINKEHLNKGEKER